MPFWNGTKWVPESTPASTPARRQLRTGPVPETLLTLLVAAVFIAGVAGDGGSSSDGSGDDVFDDASVNLSSASGYAPGQILVGYRTSALRDDIVRLEGKISARHTGTARGIRVRALSVEPGTEEQAIATLERSPLVRFAERDALVAATETIPNDTYWTGQWSAVTTRAPAAWNITTGSDSIVIAVLDTGVDPAQPDLQGKLTAGRDFVNNDDDPSDDAGHGTKVAGVVGAATDNARGVAGFCWQCRIMPVKVLGADGSGLHSSLASGIVWATDNGARIVNMSLAGDASTKTLKSAIDYAHRRGVLLVAAAGNSGSNSPTYPAAYSEVVGVAGTKANDTLYSWSNYGNWVSVAAPGTNYTTFRGDNYSMFAGTSSATPVVAGIAGLAYAFKPDASVASIQGALTSGTVPVDGHHSFGRIDALLALVELGADPTPGSSSSPSPAPTATASSSPGTPDPTPQPEPSASATPTPFADPSPTPTASASPSWEPTASPSASPSPEPTRTTTMQFRGSLNEKNPSRSYSLTTGSGTVRGSLEFKGPPTLTIVVLDADGAEVARASGSSVLTMEASAKGGSHTVAVGGDGSKATFRLALTYASP